MNKKDIKKVLKKGPHKFLYEVQVLTDDVCFDILTQDNELVARFFLSEVVKTKQTLEYHVGRN